MEIRCKMCGITFTGTGNTKYCDDCRPLARIKARQAWQNRTNYNERERVKRNEQTRAKQDQRKQDSRERVARIDKEIAEAVKAHRNKLKEDAATGDPFAIYMLLKTDSQADPYEEAVAFQDFVIFDMQRSQTRREPIEIVGGHRVSVLDAEYPELKRKEITTWARK